MSHSIAMIGAGPRALGALEALARACGGDVPAVTLFDPFPWPGAGANFAPDQSPLGLLNVPLRAIALPPSPVGFPDLAAWLGAPDADTYPQRAQLGAYLHARLAALAGAGRPRLRIIPRRVGRVTPRGGAWAVDDQPFDRVLLVPGQPATRPDDQLARWLDHAPDRVVPAYPDHRLLRHAVTWSGRVVAIRGMGLSTLDVIRLLTEGLGGRFQGGAYHPSGREPGRIVPFSLDGMPPFPKPRDGALDRALDPTRAEGAAFALALDRALALPPSEAPLALIPPLADAAARIMGTGPAPACAWLRAEIDAPGSQEQGGPVALLDRGIAMASGQAAPDVGYVIGALWRKWQNDLRRGFNSADPDPRTAAALIALDEGLKRYSYGPPVRTAQGLRALIRAGKVDPRAADDPDIRTTSHGWTLRGDHRVEAQVMVDAVLPPPDLERFSDPLLLDLDRQGLIAADGAGPGLPILPDGTLRGRAGPARGLAALGRITLGSCIAVDSIHDCFGAAADRWARAALA